MHPCWPGRRDANGPFFQPQLVNRATHLTRNKALVRMAQHVEFIESAVPQWLISWLARLIYPPKSFSPCPFVPFFCDIAIQEHTQNRFLLQIYTMAAVYKALSKTATKDEPKTNGAPRENRQRVLILSSRGVTFRLELRDAYHKPIH